MNVFSVRMLGVNEDYVRWCILSDIYGCLCVCEKDTVSIVIGNSFYSSVLKRAETHSNKSAREARPRGCGEKSLPAFNPLHSTHHK